VDAQASELVVFVTTSSSEEADKIGRMLVESRLAACANVLTGMHSIFRWDDRIAVENECLMIIKTTRRRYAELEALILQHHSYSVPEIIALPVIAGSVSYLNWIKAETDK
jgi:periplasmic divalent cation tolerance protein